MSYFSASPLSAEWMTADDCEMLTFISACPS
jgi:hypothetical protein